LLSVFPSPKPNNKSLTRSVRKLVELKLTISIIWWAGEVEDWMVVMVEGGVGGVALSPSNLRRSLELNKLD